MQSASTSTGGRGTLSAGDELPDPASVIGVRGSDRVLVVGNPAFMPWLCELFNNTRMGGSVTSVRKAADLTKLVASGKKFDRVIVSRESSYSHEHLLSAGAMCAQLTVLPQDDGWEFRQSAEFYYPTARVLSFETTHGTVMTAEPEGSSWRFAIDA